MSSFLDPAQPLGTVVLNVLASIGFVTLAVLAGWITGPFRWLVAGRALKQILLTGRSFVFVFNPSNGQSKEVTFLPNGEIGSGRNSNEFSWRIRRGKLEILAFDGKIYSRFVQDKTSGRIVHTNDADTRSIHGQFFIPRSTPWSKTIAEQDASTERRPLCGLRSVELCVRNRIKIYG